MAVNSQTNNGTGDSSNTATKIASTNNTSSNKIIQKPSPTNGERHILPPETELRLEIPSNTSATLTLLSGSAEVFGAELAVCTSSSSDAPLDLSSATNSTPINRKQSYPLFGNTKLAIFTWHGCTLDIDVEFGKSLDIVYTSDETAANVAYVNTHAQLEAMRDEVLSEGIENCVSGGKGSDGKGKDGPRVLLVGPADCGKSSLCRVLTAYAVKLGRTPLLVDLDVSQNMLSVPGTITASPMTPNSISVITHASSSSTITSNTTPLVLWYGSTDITSNPDLYKAQLTKLGQAIDARLLASKEDASTLDARASGLVINTSGEIEDVGYNLLLHAAEALRVNVILVMGHDRLYSMINTHFTKLQQHNQTEADGTNDLKAKTPKVIKLPRSGGVVSRDSTFRRISRSLCIKRYFNGDLIRPASSSSNADATLINQYTPTLLELPFSKLQLYKLSSVSLAASMLPVSAKQTTDPVQLTPMEIGPTLQHAILAVCHPTAVAAYEQSGKGSDLYSSGIAGFVAVEKVDIDCDVICLLSPCSGSLPSFTLLVGDITWME